MFGQSDKITCKKVNRLYWRHGRLQKERPFVENRASVFNNLKRQKSVKTELQLNQLLGEVLICKYQQWEWPKMACSDQERGILCRSGRKCSRELSTLENKFRMEAVVQRIQAKKRFFMQERDQQTGLFAKSCQMPVSVKLFWKSHSHHFVSAIVFVLKRQSCVARLQNLKQSVSGPLQKTFSEPSLRLSNIEINFRNGVSSPSYYFLGCF